MDKKSANRKEKVEKSLTKEVEEFMNGLKIEPTVLPSAGHTQMTEHPTSMPPKKLQTIYTAMVAWYCYSNEALAKVNIKLLEIDMKLRREIAVLHGSSTEKTKWKADDKIATDPVISKLSRIKMKLEAKKIALEVTVENYEAKSKALSRELTRRGVEVNLSGRTP